VKTGGINTYDRDLKYEVSRRRVCSCSLTLPSVPSHIQCLLSFLAADVTNMNHLYLKYLAREKWKNLYLIFRTIWTVIIIFRCY
jgi:hypothetical protein